MCRLASHRRRFEGTPSLPKYGTIKRWSHPTGLPTRLQERKLQSVGTMSHTQTHSVDAFPRSINVYRGFRLRTGTMLSSGCLVGLLFRTEEINKITNNVPAESNPDRESARKVHGGRWNVQNLDPLGNHRKRLSIVFRFRFDNPATGPFSSARNPTVTMFMLLISDSSRCVLTKHLTWRVR